MTTSTLERAVESPWRSVTSRQTAPGRFTVTGAAALNLAHLVSFDERLSDDWVFDHADLIAALIRELDATRRLQLTLPVHDIADCEVAFDLTVWAASPKEAELAFLLHPSTTHVEAIWLAGSRYRLLSRLDRLVKEYLP